MVGLVVVDHVEEYNLSVRYNRWIHVTEHLSADACR